jgi:Ca2+-binding RTX toxin-like protein
VILLGAGALLLFAATSAGGQEPGLTCDGLPATKVGTEFVDDPLEGTPGDDVIVGLGGDDFIQGFGGNDRICAGDGDDIVVDGPGNSHFEGGGGLDLLSFREGPVTVDLKTGTATGSGSDTMKEFEAIIGSPAKDIFTAGDDSADIFPRGGDDTVHGGAGLDIVGYLDPVRADLGKGQSVPATPDSDEGTDTLDRVDGFVGAPGSTFIGDGGSNYLFFGSEMRGGGGADYLFADASTRMDGGSGDDYLSGSRENDTIVGGPGRDLVSYRRSSGVRVNLAKHVSTGYGTDTLRTVEDVAGSPATDIIVGDARLNSLYGNDGGDNLRGGGGDDYLSAGGPTIGYDSIDGGKGSDYCVGGDTVLRCEFRASAETASSSARRLAPATTARDHASGLGPSDAFAGLIGKVERLACSSTSRGCGSPARPPLLAVVEPFSILTGLADATSSLTVTPSSKSPDCSFKGGKAWTTIVPPSEVEPIDGITGTQYARWQATLRRIKGRGCGFAPRTTAFYKAQIAGKNFDTPGLTPLKNWKETQHGTGYKPIPYPLVGGPGQYQWTETITWWREQAYLGITKPITHLAHYVLPKGSPKPSCPVRR